jgi:hypothetical protein
MERWQRLPIIKFLLGVLYSLYIVRNYMMRLLSLSPSPPVTGTVVIYRTSDQPYSSYSNLLKWMSTYVPHKVFCGENKASYIILKLIGCLNS